MTKSLKRPLKVGAIVVLITSMSIVPSSAFTNPFSGPVAQANWITRTAASGTAVSGGAFSRIVIPAAFLALAVTQVYDMGKDLFLTFDKPPAGDLVADDWILTKSMNPGYTATAAYNSTSKKITWSFNTPDNNSVCQIYYYTSSGEKKNVIKGGCGYFLTGEIVAVPNAIGWGVEKFNGTASAGNEYNVIAFGYTPSVTAPAVTERAKVTFKYSDGTSETVTTELAPGSSAEITVKNPQPKKTVYDNSVTYEKFNSVTNNWEGANIYKVAGAKTINNKTTNPVYNNGDTITNKSTTTTTYNPVTNTYTDNSTGEVYTYNTTENQYDNSTSSTVDSSYRYSVYAPATGDTYTYYPSTTNYVGDSVNETYNKTENKTYGNVLYDSSTSTFYNYETNTYQTAPVETKPLSPNVNPPTATAPVPPTPITNDSCGFDILAPTSWVSCLFIPTQADLTSLMFRLNYKLSGSGIGQIKDFANTLISPIRTTWASSDEGCLGVPVDFDYVITGGAAINVHEHPFSTCEPGFVRDMAKNWALPIQSFIVIFSAFVIISNMILNALSLGDSIFTRGNSVNTSTGEITKGWRRKRR
jgi:hypothetical protein